VESYRVILENSQLRLSVLSYGATITSIYDKSLLREMILGFDDDQCYVASDKYFGCTIGRVANRISNGHFKLNNVDYVLAINNGPNHLHGGIRGFDKREFQCVLMDDRIECSCFSTHMDEGYPGNLEVKIVYTLVDNQLHIQTYCQSDADTLVNLTNHSYFNLNQVKSTIGDHRLKIHANRIYPVDANGCTYNQPFEVHHTPFDFTDEKVISDCLMSNHPQIISAKGLDHHFEINGSGLRLAVQLTSKDVSLSVYTDKPGVHVYTGNYLNGEDVGYDDIAYQQHSGICFEAQYVPDSINFDCAIAPILKAGQIQEHRTVFEFNRITR
jgi:aldose 1-epimerase